MNRQIAVDRVEITDEQRVKILAACAKDRSLGHARAARAAGVKGSTGQIRRALAGDEEFQAGLSEQNVEYLKTIGLGVEQLLRKLAYVVSDDGNSSQLRAIERGLTFHGIHFHDKSHLEVTGADGGALEVTVDHDYGRLIDKLAGLGLVRRTEDALESAGQPLLPSRTD